MIRSLPLLFFVVVQLGCTNSFSVTHSSQLLQSALAHRRSDPHHHSYFGAIPEQRRLHATPPSSPVGQDKDPTAAVDDESMKDEIEAMRAEAQRRLEALSLQMEELKQHAKEYEEQHKKEEEQAISRKKEKQPEMYDTIRRKEDKMNDGHSLDSMEGDWVETSLSQSNTEVTEKADAPVVGRATVKSPNRVDTELLTDTRWKVAFNIGREAGTWMPKEWGQSGDRLLFQVVLDLTDKPLYEREEFFQGLAGAKVLEVVEAWVVPVGVGSDSHGRQPIKVKPQGGYKVLPGLGPLGTSIVRFYIDLEEEVKSRPQSDVSCPQGRVYATCGYFPRHKKVTGVPSLKEIAEEQHHAAVVRYEQLEREIETDERTFSLDRLKLMKESFLAKRNLETTTRQLQEARQRDPDKAQLRLTRDGRVGLTKEGGVCRKVYKGVALEYHILGRIELACVDKLESHDEYQELVHQLRH